MACEKALSRCRASSSSAPRTASKNLLAARFTQYRSTFAVPPNFTFAPCNTTSTKRDIPRSILSESTTLAQVSSAYALTAYPHPSSYAALVTRITGAEALASNPKLVEQACICPSFWAHIEAHPISSTPQYTLYHDTTRLDNRQLSSLGNALLGLFATEWLERKHPNLPTQVLKSALTMFVGPHTSADVARSWGVLPGRASMQSEQEISPSGKKKANSVRGQAQGWKAGTGVLRWSRTPVANLKTSGLELWQNGSAYQDAMASVAKAFVGAVHQELGLAAARQFVHTHFLSRQADLLSLLKFGNPKNVLMATLNKHEMGTLETRLLRETGRTSASPIFVVGAFARPGGEQSEPAKLGEGIGSAIKMAEHRACEDALRRLYLAPLSSSAADPLKQLPSDSLCGQQFTVAEDHNSWGEDEVEDSSAGRISKAQKELRGQSPFFAPQDPKQRRSSPRA